MQAGLVLVLVALFIILSKIMKWLGLLEVSNMFPWMVSASFILVFALFNSIFGLSSKNLNRYRGRSIIAFLGLILCSGMLARLVSGVPIGHAKSYKWIFLVLIVGYLVFLSMMGLMKSIVEFAQKEEWNQPRKRVKKP